MDRRAQPAHRKALGPLEKHKDYKKRSTTRKARVQKVQQLKRAAALRNADEFNVKMTQFAMDLARYSMTETAQKVAPADQVGDGFIDIWGAFEFAAKTLKENQATPVQKMAVGLHRFMRRLLGFAPLTGSTADRK